MYKVSYNKLFKLMIDRGISKTELAKMVGISPATRAKLSKNQYVSMEVLVKICKCLGCSFDEIVEIIPDKEIYDKSGGVTREE